MVKINYLGRLGNKLFQFVLGRMIAEARGYRLIAHPIPGFPGTYEEIKGECHDTGPQNVLTGHRIDLPAILQARDPGAVILDGFFQRCEYYIPERDKIRHWLRMEDGTALSMEMPDLLIHVRRADYVQHGWALPFSFYRSAIEEYLPSGGKLVIATDDPLDPFFWSFRCWKPKFFRGSIPELMQLMKEAPCLLMSQSTFSWWPAFLGKENRLVLCPNPAFGIWSGLDEVALASPVLFKCLSCREEYRPNATEALYQKARLLGVRITNRISKARGLPARKF